MSGSQNCSFKRPVLFIPDKMTQFHGIQRTVLKTILSYVWFFWRMSGSGEPFFPMSGFLSLRLKFLLKPGSWKWWRLRFNFRFCSQQHFLSLFVVVMYHYQKEREKSGTRGITTKICSSSGEVLRSFVESSFRLHIHSWNPATGCGALTGRKYQSTTRPFHPIQWLQSL
jgi:hypothetical protein